MNEHQINLIESENKVDSTIFCQEVTSRLLREVQHMYSK